MYKFASDNFLISKHFVIRIGMLIIIPLNEIISILFIINTNFSFVLCIFNHIFMLHRNYCRSILIQRIQTRKMKYTCTINSYVFCIVPKQSRFKSYITLKFRTSDGEIIILILCATSTLILPKMNDCNFTKSAR